MAKIIKIDKDEHPFKNVIVYGPYLRKSDKREMVTLYDPVTQKKTSMSYPKFLKEVELGRKLDPNMETVDHIDGNFLDNSAENTRIIPRSQHSKEDRIICLPIYLPCVWCGKIVETTSYKVNTSINRGKASPFCNKTCSGQYSRSVQLGRQEPAICHKVAPHKGKRPKTVS